MTAKNKIKIVIVEDNQYYNQVLTKYVLNLAKGFKNIYPNYEFKISSYTTASDCVETLEKDTDILLLDYFFSSEEDKFEGINGEDVLDVIINYCNNCKVIMVTGQNQVPIAVELMKKGVYEYVDKNTNTLNRVGAILQQIINEICREEVKV